MKASTTLSGVAYNKDVAWSSPSVSALLFPTRLIVKKSDFSNVVLDVQPLSISQELLVDSLCQTIATSRERPVLACSYLRPPSSHAESLSKS